MSRRQRVPVPPPRLIDGLHHGCKNTHPGGPTSTSEMPSRTTVRPPCLNDEPIRKCPEQGNRQAFDAFHRPAQSLPRAPSCDPKFLTRALTD